MFYGGNHTTSVKLNDSGPHIPTTIIVQKVSNKSKYFECYDRAQVIEITGKNIYFCKFLCFRRHYNPPYQEPGSYKVFCILGARRLTNWKRGGYMYEDIFPHAKFMTYLEASAGLRLISALSYYETTQWERILQNQPEKIKYWQQLYFSTMHTIYMKLTHNFRAWNSCKNNLNTIHLILATITKCYMKIINTLSWLHINRVWLNK